MTLLIAVLGTSILAASPAHSLAKSQTEIATPVVDHVGLALLFEIRAAGEEPDPATLIELRTILRQQLALLGVEGQVIRRQDGKILVRVDAASDPEGITRALTATPLLEIVDTRGQTLPPGTIIRTSLSPSTVSATPVSVADADATDPVFTTIVSGADLSDVKLIDDPATGQPLIGFNLNAEAEQRLFNFTSTHIGEPMAIVLDKRVISSPTIASAIESEGVIAGVPPEDVHLLFTQLKIGTLGVPLVLIEQRLVPAAEATVGSPSNKKSLSRRGGRGTLEPQRRYSPGMPPSSTIGRTSTVPMRAPGMRPAMSMASSRSLASIR